MLTSLNDNYHFPGRAVALETVIVVVVLTVEIVIVGVIIARGPDRDREMATGDQRAEKRGNDRQSSNLIIGY